ncbi:MAG: prepilin peptidase [Bacteroidota bacterium]|jgi:leader peptidase (prepilin peptidase)/N-methyltransferase
MIESFIIVSLLGLSLGSFINVCGYRLPRGVSVLALRSFCPSCNHCLTWYELIPVAGYTLNRGRCRYCKERISPSYPIVEIISAAILIVLLLKYTITLEFALSSIFCLLMVLIAIIDWKHLIIPNQIVIMGFIFGLAMKALVNSNVLVHAIISSIGSLVMVAIILLLSNLFFKKETMGWGDVKLAGVIGLFLGFQNFLIILWMAAIVGTLYALTRSGKENAHFAIGNLQSEIDFKIPFGSFLAVAGCIVLYFQETISELIQSWLTYAQ